MIQTYDMMFQWTMLVRDVVRVSSEARSSSVNEEALPDLLGETCENCIYS